MTAAKPASRPVMPHFSSGPCAKRPGWNPQNLKDAALGRSHRAKIGKAKLKQAIELTREVLEVPADYKIGIVPASDTGAVEMALWSLLGARPVTTIAWESFGDGWVSDIIKELKLKDVTQLHAGYGDIPEEDILKDLTVPTIFVSGTKDKWINPEKVAQLEDITERYELPVTSVKYEADHAFFNNTRPEVYDETAARDAWALVVGFFNDKL